MRFTNRRALALLVGAASVGLAACQPPDQSGMTTGASDFTLRSEVDQQIAQSSANAANALQTLAMIQRARTAPAPSPINESAMPPELLRPTTLEWSGMASEAAKSLAANIGYGFILGGRPPQTPVMVSLNVKDVSAAKAFEMLGLQVQSFATVVVDPNKKRVEFRYENAEPRPMNAPPLRGRARYPAVTK